MKPHERGRRDACQEGVFQLFGDLVSTHEGMCHKVLNFESFSRIHGQDAPNEILGIL